MASNQLQKITKRAQQLRKASPKMEWRVAVQKASKELKRGAVSGVKKAKPKKRVTVVNISGSKTKHKKKATMAKKKRRSSPRRRRSGIGSVKMFSGYQRLFMTTLGAVGGGILAGAVDGFVSKYVKNPKLSSAIQLAGGLFVAKQFEKQPLFSGAGMGIAAFSGGALLKKSGFLSGIGDGGDLAGDEWLSGPDDEAGGLAGDEGGDLGDADDPSMGDDELM